MLASGLTQEEIAMVQGAMNIDYNFGEARASSIAIARPALPGEAAPPNGGAVLIEQAEVRGQLEMAEAALRQATAPSLAIAATRLPTPNVLALATSPIEGH